MDATVLTQDRTPDQHGVPAAIERAMARHTVSFSMIFWRLSGNRNSARFNQGILTYCGTAGSAPGDAHRR
jgi:hypothetical protein